jgi:hypothetical protein
MDPSVVSSYHSAKRTIRQEMNQQASVPPADAETVPPPTAGQAHSEPAGRQIALLLAAVSLALYLRTLAPDVLPGDPGEFQAAAWRLGLAHPTGYPLYLLLGSAWQHTLAWMGVSPAAALNGLSALLAAAAVGLAYLVMVQWPAQPVADSPVVTRRLAAVYSAALLATNLTFWSQALIAEVYALHTLLVLALILAAQAVARADRQGRRWLGLALLAGLALTHHAMTLLLLPALALYLGWHTGGRPALPRRTWLGVTLAFLLPLLLYLYIPLRSGPDASPWYHQMLGDTPLTLYGQGWPAFAAFISGESIAAGFRSLPAALAQLPQAAWLWRYHFGWVGLVMMAVGLFWLVRRRAWPVLGLTLAYALVQQIFVLFYDIGDILVYYIPLYLVGALWAGFGLLGLATGGWRAAEDADGAAPPPLGWLLAGGLLLWTLRDLPVTAAAIDQTGSQTARTQWEAILAAQPPASAVLVSNDRNEIVPLFYLQVVEGRGLGLTGIFPLIAPEPRFADLGATLDTVLAASGDPPVYLIKPMPGLEVKYRLAPAASPLVEVVGLGAAPPEQAVDQRLGPLRLLGYDLEQTSGGLAVRLHWQVEAALDGDYTATVQLLDAAGEKLAQDDHPPGGVYYPTSLWKPGEHLVDTHTLALSAPVPAGARLLVGMYRGADLTLLAPSLELALTP